MSSSRAYVTTASRPGFVCPRSILDIQQFLPLIWKYTNVQELTPHILNELIEKIVVHEKEIGEDGVKTQQVDIYYKFIGCVNIRRAKADHAEIIKAEQGQADHRTA